MANSTDLGQNWYGIVTETAYLLLLLYLAARSSPLGHAPGHLLGKYLLSKVGVLVPHLLAAGLGTLPEHLGTYPLKHAP